MTNCVATACPVCGGLIEIIHMEEGAIVECPDCNEAFRVVSLEPLELTYAYDLDEEGEFDDEERPRG